MSKRYMSSSTFALSPWLLLWSLWSAPAAWALDSDKEHPIQITADSAIRDEIAGETRYEGNVVLTQGSLKITADQLSISHREKDADRIVAIGRPATLVQQPSLDQGPVDASANRIEYIRAEDLVRLRDDARVAQSGSTLSGEQIDYLLTQRRVLAAGTTGDQGQGRVQVVIPPENLRTTDRDD
mgnify:CR=1 FL=1